MKKLVFHVGRPKTGTTFLQKRIQTVPNCLYLGAKYNKDKMRGEVKSDELNHSQIFPAVRRDVLPSYRNFTSNSYDMANSYANMICREIKDTRMLRIS